MVNSDSLSVLIDVFAFWIASVACLDGLTFLAELLTVADKADIFVVC